MTKKKALVAGALGVLGGNTIEELIRSGGWEVVGVSRAKPAGPINYEHISVDLTDPAASKQKLGGLTDVTHIFYAARAPHPSKLEEAKINRQILANLIEAFEPAAKNLEHVHMGHGTKWYANQNGPYRTPSRETDPRSFVPIFYYDQQDYIVERQKGKSWGWSSMRPGLICGYSVGYPHNLMTLIAVYALVSKELGMPLRYPGNPGGYSSLYQAVDVGLLARASIWAATTPGCANEAFNINNGDYYRWENLWPKIAEFFEMEAGPVQTIELTKQMPPYKEVWNRIVAKYNLVPNNYEDMANWAFGDLLFNIWWDDISSIIKLRKYGFTEALDTEQMFVDIFDDFRRRRIIP